MAKKKINSDQLILVMVGLVAIVGIIAILIMDSSFKEGLSYENLLGEAKGGKPGKPVEPPQEPVTCSDSDGGLDYYKRGTVKYDSLRERDECKNDRYLWEYHCGDGIIEDNKYFIMASGDVKTFIQYKGYNVADAYVSFRDGEGVNYAVSVTADGMFELIINGESNYFKVLNMNSIHSPIQVINAIIVEAEEVHCYCNKGECPEPYCGNGIVETGEECDDGNNYNGDGCDENCEFEALCGNGILEPGEECEWNMTRSCLDNYGRIGIERCYERDCQWEGSCEPTGYCGDGYIDAGEHCDGNNLGDRPGCTYLANFNSGTLYCTTNRCTYDTSGCIGDFACTFAPNGLVNFALYTNQSGWQYISDYLRDGETKTYTFNGIDYEVTAVYIAPIEPKSAILSINGILTKELNEGESDALPGISVKMNNIMTTPGSGIVDYYLLDVTTADRVDGTLEDMQTKTYTMNGMDYEVTAVFINGPNSPSALLSVNGMLTKELSPGETDLLGGGVFVGIYSVEVCTSTCGNGIIDYGEQCDGENLNGMTCQDWGYLGGTLKCSSYCTSFDTGECFKTLPCYDSDGGRNYYVKGYATINNGSTKYTDECSYFSNIGYVLFEYYCEGNNIRSESYGCPGKCEDGACINQTQNITCIDSDGGRNYYVNGLTRGITPAGYFTNSYDYCVDNNVLEEYYCYNNLVYDYRYTCPSGYSCVNGACIR